MIDVDEYPILSTHPVAQPLGERNADPQPRIGAGALAHGHGIQFIGRNARFAQKLVDEHADLAGMVAPLVALAQRKHNKVSTTFTSNLYI